jgi:hypothetical protein
MSEIQYAVNEYLLKCGIVSKGISLGAGIGHGAAQFLVSQKPLNGSNAAARIEQLRGADVPEAMASAFRRSLPPTMSTDSLKSWLGQFIVCELSRFHGSISPTALKYSLETVSSKIRA